MISVANLLDMEEEISRRSFVRRLFAMGAGIAASGSIVRSLSGTLLREDAYDEAYFDYWAVTVNRRGTSHVYNLTDGVSSIHEWAAQKMPRDEALIGYMSIAPGANVAGTFAERGTFHVAASPSGR